MAYRPEFEDVIIVGGGPAGLNAALVRGRCRRKVVVFDDGNPSLETEGHTSELQLNFLLLTSSDTQLRCVIERATDT